MSEGRIISQPDHSCKPPADVPAGTVWECGCGWRWTSKGHTTFITQGAEGNDARIEYPTYWWRESRRQHRRRLRREKRDV